MAVFVRTRWLLQRFFILSGWAIFAFWSIKLAMYGVAPEVEGTAYAAKAIARLAFFPAAGHLLAYVIRVGDYHSR